MTTTQLFACLRYADANGAIAFLEAIGFESRLVVRRESDPAFVEHAQLRWRETGGVMLGSVRDDDPGWTIHAGMATTNLVVASDADVDRVLDAAIAAGATVARPPSNEEYGGRNAIVRDSEGNLWSIDSYPGE
jgi:PhnB protein